LAAHRRAEGPRAAARRRPLRGSALARPRRAARVGRRTPVAHRRRAASALKELGFGALQVWQSVSEAQGRGQGEKEVAILFTDLVEFSAWAREVGDDRAVELLRAVGGAVEPKIAAGQGRIVKRLGDGLMAVFDDTESAVKAACGATASVAELEVGGYRPHLRAGVHLGRPRRLGGDFYGVAVNVAARIAGEAGADEVLVSDAVCERLPDGAVKLKRKRRFKAKGAPRETQVFRVETLTGAGPT